VINNRAINEGNPHPRQYQSGIIKSGLDIRRVASLQFANEVDWSAINKEE